MNVARLVALATEEEKPKAADPKNFWHAGRNLAASPMITRKACAKIFDGHRPPLQDCSRHGCRYSKRGRDGARPSKAR